MGVHIFSLHSNKEARIYVKNKDGINKFMVIDDGNVSAPNLVKKNTNYYIYQSSGHHGPNYLHAHGNKRIGAGQKKDRDTFQLI